MTKGRKTSWLATELGLCNAKEIEPPISGSRALRYRPRICRLVSRLAADPFELKRQRR